MTLEKLEEQRIKIRDFYVILIVVAALGAVLFIAFTEMPEFALFFAMAVFLIGGLIKGKDKKKYISDFKKYFVNGALQNKFTDLKYTPNQGMPYQTIASTKMMYMGDRYHSNDFISGKYKNIDFSQADVHIEEERERRDSDGNTETYYVTLFRGRWMIFDFNKTFKADLQVCQKGFGNNKAGGLFSKDVFHKVKMESSDFNKAFNIYAQSEHEAFYILTPALMEKIMRLDQMNSGKLLLCFINNRLHIGLYDGKDSFEHAPIWKKIDPEQTKSKIAADINQITMFVDELDLDNDLFRKEV